MKVGNLTMNNTSQIGDGSGQDSASCHFDSSVLARNIANTIQDKPIKVQ